MHYPLLSYSLFFLGFEEAFGWDGELGVADGGAVSAEEDGVHYREGAANTEGEAEEESDDGAEVDAHSFNDFMREGCREINREASVRSGIRQRRGRGSWRRR